jgi:predicted dehydrogenase
LGADGSFGLVIWSEGIKIECCARCLACEARGGAPRDTYVCVEGWRMMQEDGKASRRDFLKQTAVAAGAGLVASQPGRSRAAQKGSANERIHVGVIGCGGMGNGHIGQLLKFREQGLVEIAGVCDVYSKRLDGAAKRTGAKPYKVWSDLVGAKDVDAVLIATPDHWHAPMTIAAAEAGKDIYCEKPMTYWGRLGDAKKVVEVVAKHQRVMQVGTQFLSDDIWELAVPEVGSLGTLMHVQSCDCRNHAYDIYSPKTSDPDAVPGKTLDWDMWLGPAPKRPYEPGRFSAFRAYWDYSGGIGTDLFPHILTPWVKMLKLGFPKRVVAAGGIYYYKDGREVPDLVNLCVDYPDGPTVMLLATLANDTGLTWQIRGQKATMSFDGPTGPAKIEPQRAAGGGETREIKGSRHWSLENHWLDFLDCVKTRKQPRSDAAMGYKVMTVLHMGVRSVRSGMGLGFDPQTETVHVL